MKKEYIVVEITAPPDGGPYVLVTLAEPKDLSESRSLFGPQMMGFKSLDELFKGLGKAISMQLMGRFTTTIKLDIREYEDSGLKVGDRVYLEITKIEKEGV